MATLLQVPQLELPIITVLYAALIVVLCAIVIWIVHRSLSKASKKIPSNIVRDAEIGADLLVIIIGMAAIYSVLGVGFNVFVVLVLLILLGLLVATRDLLPAYAATYALRSLNALKPNDWISVGGTSGTVLQVGDIFTVVQGDDGMIHYFNNQYLVNHEFSVYSPLSMVRCQVELTVPSRKVTPELLDSVRKAAGEIAKASGIPQEPTVEIGHAGETDAQLVITVPVTGPKRIAPTRTQVLLRLLEILQGTQ